MATTRQEARVVDFAVVGAGVAGLYVAWRLARALRPRPEIAIFEAQSRIGGRLLTAPLPSMPFLAELGGMRYITGHRILSKLVERLSLTSVPFEFPLRFMLLRSTLIQGRARIPYSLPNPRDPVAFVKKAMRLALLYTQCPKSGKHSTGIQGKIDDIRYGRSDLSVSTFSNIEWEVIKRKGVCSGYHLASIGFWNLLHRYLESEEFFFVRDALGYHSIFGNWNAAEAIPWFLNDFDATYNTIDGGMDRLASNLAFELRFLCHGCLHTETKVSSIRYRKADALMEVGFAPRQRKVLARNVILALPKAALRANTLTYSGFEPKQVARLDRALESVAAHPLFKLFLGYERAWWGRFRSTNEDWGRAVTDMPIRQVYYFGPGRAFDETQAGMLMASYSDAHFVDFWRPLHRRPSPELAERPSFCELTSLTDEGRRLLKALGATERMVNKAHGQIKLMHPGLEIPDPVVALEKEWPEGWHSWKPNYKPWEVMQRLKRPFEANLFICGEAFSSEQGWIEGSLRSAELVLRELGVGLPDWLNSSFASDEDFNCYIGNWTE